MTMRLYIAPSGTAPGDGPGEGWTEIGAAVGDVDFTAQIEPDEPWVPMTTSRTFTATVTAPGLHESIKALFEKSERDLMYRHALAGGPWRYGDTRSNLLDEWARGFIDGRRRGRGGP